MAYEVKTIASNPFAVRGETEWPTPKGKLRAYYSIWCGKCGGYEDVPYGGRRAYEYIRNIGWKLTRKYGWICPVCEELIRTGKITPL